MATQTTDGQRGAHGSCMRGLFLSLRHAFLHPLRFLLPQIFPRHGGQNCSTKSVTSSDSGTRVTKPRKPIFTESNDSSSSTTSAIPVRWAKPKWSSLLTALAVDRHVSAATQNQALHALFFLYREVLAQELGWLNDMVPAKHSTATHGAHSARSESAPERGRWHPMVDGQSALWCWTPVDGMPTTACERPRFHN